MDSPADNFVDATDREKVTIALRMLCPAMLPEGISQEQYLILGWLIGMASRLCGDDS